MKKALMCESLENFSSTEMLEEIYRERGLKKKSLFCNADLSPHPLNTVRLLLKGGCGVVGAVVMEMQMLQLVKELSL